MIQPHDLMVLADRLAAIPRETEGRAAVSRAYYSAFHVAKSLIEKDCGIVLPGGPEVHRKLQLCLANSQNVIVNKIADRLQSLREERNRADYKLTDSTFANIANVQMLVDRGKEIVSLVAAAVPHVASFQNAIRAYAGNVLKLRLKTV